MSQSKTVNLMLRGGRVTAAFRSALFAAAGRAGMSVNEFVLWSVGEHLANAGNFDGVFEPGDLQAANDDGALKLNQSGNQSGRLTA